MINRLLHESYQPLFKYLNTEEFYSFYYDYLSSEICYPHKNLIFKPFLKPISDIKVVIIGDSPYPFCGNNGLAFGIENKSSLVTNELKAIEQAIKYKKEENHFPLAAGTWKTLEHLQNQGVFLLNRSLTTFENEKHTLYWQKFINNTIKLICSVNPCIWLLWGNHDLSKLLSNSFCFSEYNKEMIQEIPINNDWNYFRKIPYLINIYNEVNDLFISNNQFNITNELLTQQGKSIINW